MAQIRKWKSLLSGKNILYSSVMVALIIIVPLSLSEIYLRIDGGLDTYAEKTGRLYRSYYNQEPSSLYWNHPIDTTYTIDQGDFNYEYETNELGLREKRNAISNPDTSTFRILTLGDSFTEGFGASPDSAWPCVLETGLSAVVIGSKKVQVYNAGMAGSDPFFNYVMLKDKLLVFKPHLVIQTVNTSDLSDFLFRGGMGRFQDGRVIFRKGPWWELIYRFSYTFRLVAHEMFGKNFMLVTEKERRYSYDLAVNEYLSLFKKNYAQLADSIGFEMLYVIQPMPCDLRFVGDGYERLMRLDSLLHANGIRSVDLLAPMSGSVGADSEFEYSWKVDGHYNAKGYRQMGLAVSHQIDSLFNNRAIGWPNQ